jgi:hypothetical protein
VCTQGAGAYSGFQHWQLTLKVCTVHTLHRVVQDRVARALDSVDLTTNCEQLDLSCWRDTYTQ